MQYRSIFWPIIIFMISINTSIMYSMERPTETFLQAVVKLPPDIQREIAFYMVGEFFLVANILSKYTTPIYELVLINDKLGVELHHDKKQHHRKEELWNFQTEKLLHTRQNAYDIQFGYPNAVGYGPLDIGVVRNTPPKKLLPTLAKAKKKIPLYINLKSPKLNTTDHPLTLLKNSLTIPQAELIMRLFNETKEGYITTLYPGTLDGEVFLSHDKKIRIYLLQCLNMKLKTKPGKRDEGCCVVQ